VSAPGLVLRRRKAAPRCGAARWSHCGLGGATVAEEDLRSDRCGRDRDPLVCGPDAAPAVGQLGGGPQAGPQILWARLWPLAGFALGGPPMAEADWRGLVCEWFPELADARLRQVSWPVHGHPRAGSDTPRPY
jgi:hypothetical protein